MCEKVIVLLSGGLDSAACAAASEEQARTRCMFVDYGQPAAKWEKIAADQICAALSMPLTSVTVSSHVNFGLGEIVGRNAFLVLTALMFSSIQVGKIVIGIHAGTPYYDCTAAFLVSMNRLAGEYTDGKVRVVAPFLQQSKLQIVEYLRTTVIRTEMTYSCEAGTQTPCGRCMSCRDRKAIGC